MNMIVYDGVSALSENHKNFEMKEFQSLTRLKKYKKTYLIIDEDAYRIHQEIIDDIIKSFDASYMRIYSGAESSKTIETALELIEDMTKKDIDRRDVLVAIGGGSVLDLSGFVASIYKRGMDWYNLPTTLLSAVDASLGGKTAINTPYGKNLIGSFHMPAKTIIIDRFLMTLPKMEVYSGFGEILKMSMLKSRPLYEELLKSEDISDISKYWDMIALMGEYKLEIVKQDFRDLLGIRAVLNFGHTYGHAVEKLSNAQLKHGICVLYGIDFALFISMKKLGFPEEEYEKYHLWLKNKEFYQEISYSKADILNYMKRDKKTVGNTVGYVCLKEIGKPVVCEIPLFELEELLMSYKA